MRIEKMEEGEDVRSDVRWRDVSERGKPWQRGEVNKVSREREIWSLRFTSGSRGTTSPMLHSHPLTAALLLKMLYRETTTVMSCFHEQRPTGSGWTGKVYILSRNTGMLFQRAASLVQLVIVRDISCFDRL